MGTWSFLRSGLSMAISKIRHVLLRMSRPVAPSIRSRLRPGPKPKFRALPTLVFRQLFMIRAQVLRRRALSSRNHLFRPPRHRGSSIRRAFGTGPRSRGEELGSRATSVRSHSPHHTTSTATVRACAGLRAELMTHSSSAYTRDPRDDGRRR
jgi:hypothetical protein